MNIREGAGETHFLVCICFTAGFIAVKHVEDRCYVDTFTLQCSGPTSVSACLLSIHSLHLLKQSCATRNNKEIQNDCCCLTVYHCFQLSDCIFCNSSDALEMRKSVDLMS